VANFAPGSLWHSVVERTDHAIACGALQRIPTRNTFIKDQDVRFILPVVESIERKRMAGREQKRTGANPFLPYESDLYVGDLSDSHVGLLNKFNVVDHHLLIVTKAYEGQDSPLNLRDFEAMWLCLVEFDGLAFYNGGVVAGASQPHKHLQQVPVPLGEGPGRTPMDPVLASIRLDEQVRTVPELPFIHAVAGTKWCTRMTAFEAALYTLALYDDMRRAVRLEDAEPYNLLVTRDWMLLVPRTREHYETISVNALGFAGSILVRNETELEIVRQRGPWEVLRHVSKPIPH
jgi:ATP adenylyltransferase